VLKRGPPQSVREDQGRLRMPGIIVERDGLSLPKFWTVHVDRATDHVRLTRLRHKTDRRVVLVVAASNVVPFSGHDDPCCPESGLHQTHNGLQRAGAVRDERAAEK